jgi:glycogen(starch) synthase
LAPSRFAPHIGGIETVVLDLAQRLQEAGDDVLVVTHREPADLPVRETIDAVGVRRFRFESPSRKAPAAMKFLLSLPGVARALNAEVRPDVIHVHGAANQLLPISRFATAREIPLLITTHGEIRGDDQGIYGKSRYMRATLRHGVKRAAAITAPSEQPLGDLRRVAGYHGRPEVVVPNGITTADWASGTSTPASSIVLAWGRLERQKGFDRLLAAWPRVRCQLPHARLLIAGDGNERRALEGALSPGASLLGQLDRPALARHLVHAQLAAVPSRVEAFGMSALEALAGGRPVLHSGVPALGELVGENGWSVPHDDPAALADGIVAALTAAPRTVRPAVVAQYDWPAVVSRYRALYRSASVWPDK